MFRKYFLPFLAILGALFGLFIVYWTQKELPQPPILFPPPRSPYMHTIAGAGIIETSSRNRAIGTPFNEIVSQVYVVEGDFVKHGDPLFELDLRNFESEKKATEAALNAAMIALQDKEKQFTFYQRLESKSAVSEQIYSQANFAYLEAKENVLVAKANLEVINVNIERSIIRAPIDGQILQVNIHTGELAPVNPFFSNQATAQSLAQGSLILMGEVQPLNLRVDINEEDAWRYQPGAKATAFVRGNSHINFPMQFVRIEPYVIPKSSFTGETTERVDTRVLQVLYSFEKNDLPIYAGMILDVFIESQPISEMVQR